MGIFDFAIKPNVNALKQKKDTRGLIKALQYPKNSAIRADAALALGDLREKSCKPELYACLDDKDEAVRTAAVKALNTIDQTAGENRPTRPRREMRIFISSTFRDMQKERDILIRQVFPEIRQLCQTRGVGFTEIDLRWGVTEQQAERGEVLPVCIAEIENSRPYFIGLLGERYGSIPDRIDPNLMKEQPWLKENQEASLTELEILHGVLNHPEDMSRVLFYFRDPIYVDGLAPAERSDYVSEGPSAQEKLRRLKDQIRASRLPLIENYPDPSALGKLVHDDLKKAVEQDFPLNSLDPLDQETVNQDAFAETRCKVYIHPAEIFTKLNQQVESSHTSLVLTGDSGVGKSALLANWAAEYQFLHPEAFVLCHYIGATAQSTSFIAIQKRIMAELKRRFQIDRELPSDLKEIKKAFAEWLHLAANRGTIVLILDGLNQLEDRDNAPDLVWLPETFPSSIKVILSTIPGRSLEAAQKRNWQVFEVKGLEIAERKRMIYTYLAQYRKRLDNHQVDEIATVRQTSNPLFLKALLDELRIFGVYEKLEERIRYYLQSDTVGTLYQRILERLEQDYTYTDGSVGLVKDALSLIWAARDGLNEDELLKLLGQGGELLPRAVWSPLYLSIQDSLVSRAGTLTFFHNYLKEAVQQRYLPQINDQRKAHRRLGEFFESQPVKERMIRELPWQWLYAEEWSRLTGLLANLDFYSRVWQSSEYEVKSYWTTVEAHSPLSAVEAYWPVFDAPEKHLAVVREISILMEDIGHMREAIALREFLVDHYRSKDEKDMLVGSLNNLAILLQKRGDLKGAILLEQEAELLCLDGVASTLDQIVTANNKAAFLHDEGNLSGALEIWEQLAIFCRENDHYAELPKIMNNIGMVQRALGKWDEALEKYQESEQLSRSTSDSASLIGALAGQANILGSRSLNDEAIRINQKVAQLCRNLGDKRQLHSVLSSQVVLYISIGNLEQAYPLAVEEEKIAHELGDQQGLASALTQLGVIEQGRGNNDQALSLLRDSEKICRQIGDKEILHSALGNQATILRQRRQLEDALKLQKEVEQICRDLGDLRGLQTSLGNQANIHFEFNDLEGALDLHRQKVAICRQIGFVSGLALGLANQGAVLSAMGRVQEAHTCVDEAFQIAKQYQLAGIQQQVQHIYQLLTDQKGKMND
jgi:tetratricopeptide (TPR) repeat protein